MANRPDWPRNHFGKYVAAPSTMEDKLIEYYSDVTLGPHTCRGAAKYTGMSHQWCHVRWAEILERREELSKVRVDTWRSAQMRDIDKARETCNEILEDKDSTAEDKIAAAKLLVKCAESEMKLTGTARPVQVQILEGSALEEFMKTQPADVVAKIQAGDQKAIAEAVAAMQAQKAGS